jgi:uncharacterized MAPEG superfamily protein
MVLVVAEHRRGTQVAAFGGAREGGRGMSIPVWVLLGFAVWTLLTLVGSIGVYRWSLILTRRAQISEFQADNPQGADWYRRAMRAHANCLESLPVYAAIVVASVAAGVHGRTLDVLAIVLLAARVCQTITHIGWTMTNRATAIRFSFFFVQIVCMFWMSVYVALRAA